MNSAIAFNQGSDTRLAGQPSSSNPYPSHAIEYQYWSRGWHHCDRNWASDIAGTGKPYRLLPLVVR